MFLIHVKRALAVWLGSLLLVSLLLLSASGAALAGGPYVGLKALVSSANNKSTAKAHTGTLGSEEDHFTQGGFALSAGWAYQRPGLWLRFELENTMRFGNKKIKNRDADFATEIGLHNSTLFNLYLDLPLDEIAVPYIGVGVGLGLLRYDGKASLGGPQYEKSGSALALEYALSAGLELKIRKNLSLDFAVRYLGGNDYDIKYGGHSSLKEEISVVNAEFGAGLRYNF